MGMVVLHNVGSVSNHKGKQVLGEVVEELIFSLYEVEWMWY